jgi:ankyrin repeat protein
VAQLVTYEQIEINSRTIGGETPLHYAVTVGSDAVVNVLLKAGSDPSIEAKRGTPLDLALGYPHCRFV